MLFVAGLHMGVVGAGLATVIAEAVSAVLCVIYVYFRKPSLIRFGFFAPSFCAVNVIIAFEILLPGTSAKSSILPTALNAAIAPTPSLLIAP